MDLQDVVLLLFVIWLVIEIINGSGGGGHRARVPSY